MRLWKQFVVSLAVVCAGVLVWGRLAPGAGDTLKGAGLPDGLVAAIAPAAGDAGAKQSGQGRRQSGGFGGPTLVVTKPVQLALREAGGGRTQTGRYADDAHAHRPLNLVQ